MFKNRSLNFKLRFSFAILILFLIGVGVIGIRSLKQVSASYGHVAKINLPNTISLATMDSSSREILRRILQFNLEGNTAEDLERIEKSIKDNLKEFQTEVAAQKTENFSDEEKALFSKMNNEWTTLSGFFEPVIALAKNKDEGSRIKFSEMYRGQMKKSRDGFFENLKKLIQYQKQESNRWTEQAESTANFSNMLTVGTVVIGTILASLIAFFISSRLTAQLRDLSNNLADGAEIVGKASQDIAQSSDELSSSVSEQAAAIQETTASAEELSAMVKKNEESTQRSTEVSKSSSQSVQTGKNSVNDMIHAIEEIHQSNQRMMGTVEKNNQNFTEIMAVINDITNKTKVINEIVFQTKLLSFNASVEAARAGEQGKGFAVVAEEVGNLAQMSGNAAKEISDMLSESTRKVESIVQETKSQVEVMVNEGKEKVEKGISVAHRCNEVLDEIVKHVKEVDYMVGEIALASREQSTGISEITKAMGQLDHATQLNAVSSKAMAASSVELSSQASSLNNSVMILKQTVDG